MRHLTSVPLVPPSLFLALAACGGGSDAAGPPDQQTTSIAMAPQGGNGQTAAVSTQLPEPLRVIVRRDGSPASGVTVSWSVTAGGGSLAPSSSSTDADGVASSVWTLGPAAGEQGARATLQGATGSPVSFAATATGGGGPVNNVVRVENDIFSPATITVSAGATVVWDWPAGSVSHNILPVAPATIPNSPDVRNGPATYQVNFPAAGTYRYYCGVHGTPTSGMRGTVVVQ